MGEFSDEQLVRYIELHSHTERALVYNDHVRRFLALAGEPMPADLERVAFIACHYSDIYELLKRAKANLAAQAKAGESEGSDAP